MSIGYQLSLGDILWFQQYEFDHARRARKRRWLFGWGGALVVIALFALVSAIVGNWAFVVLGVALGMLYAFLAPNLLRQNIRNTALKLYSQEPGRSLLGNRGLSISEEGLVATTADGGETLTPWTAISGLERTADYAIIYVGQVAAHVVPKNALLEGDLEAFLVELERHLPQSA